MLALMLWLRRLPVGSRTGGSRLISPFFSDFAEFGVRQWTAEVSCPRVTQLVWLACWGDTSDRSASTVVQDIYRDELGTVPPDLMLALRSAFDRNCDEFWNVCGPVTSSLQAFIGRGTSCISGDDDQV